MNFREGMRRVGLTLGVIGALTGLVFSAVFVRSYLWEAEQWNAFQKKATPIVRNLSPAVVNSARGASVEINSGGVVWVGIDSDGLVRSIRYEDGGFLERPWTRPEASLLVFAALMPVGGFLIPWSIVRTIAWIGCGFAAGNKGAK